MRNKRLFIPSNYLDSTSAALWCDEIRKEVIGEYFLEMWRSERANDSAHHGLHKNQNRFSGDEGRSRVFARQFLDFLAQVSDRREPCRRR